MKSIKIDDILKDNPAYKLCVSPQPKVAKPGPNQKKRKVTGDRPEAIGRSQQACSGCGGTDHNMLSKKCRARRR
jgi:hypothetical protein